MSNYESSAPVGKIVTLVLVILGLFTAFMLVKIKTVSGNELGVRETWSAGVDPEPLPPKTHIFFPGFTTTVYVYDMGMQLYVMNDKNGKEEIAEGRASDAYVVQSSDQQDMRISLRVQWQRRPEKIVELHKIAQNQVEERILRPAILNVVKNNATTYTALDVYSGSGLVKLQQSIKDGLQKSPELNHYVQINDFVIEHIGLDKKYTEQIVERQVAVQERLKNIEKTKAAEAAAEKAKAEAQADYEKTLVEAKRDKEKGILDAERLAQQQILAAEAAAKQVALQAEAEKNKNVLLAIGEKEAAMNRSEAILALGKAEAEAKKLQLLAYSGEGAELFARIEVSKNMTDAFKNIQGYLPESMSVNLLADQYNKGVNLLVGGDNGGLTVKK